jgi:hypothetical protein
VEKSRQQHEKRGFGWIVWAERRRWLLNDVGWKFVGVLEVALKFEAELIVVVGTLR